MSRTACIAAALSLLTTIATAQDYVIVTVDMDAQTPGIQTTIDIPAGTTQVEDVAVYIYDPAGRHSLYAIGYTGGIDRGIAFGHTPANRHAGRVTAMTGEVVRPVNPANIGVLWPDGAIQKGFNGPEVQYIECCGAAPAPIPIMPDQPVFIVDIELTATQRGDVFEFYLLDFVAVWFSGWGAFSTTGGINTLDTGGDAVPDGTVTAHGIDPDTPIPVPPAAFLVDFVDGAPATITVDVCPGDLNGDGRTDLADLGILLADFGCTPPGPCVGDLNGDGNTDLADLGILLSDFGCAP